MRKLKIIDAKINWNIGVANQPKLRILVDKIPQMEVMTFKVKEQTYLAQLGGYVRYFSYRGPGNDGGFYGTEFKINLHRGEDQVIPFTLKGPWSSRAGVVNTVFDEQIMDVSITDNPDRFEQDRMYYSGAITLDMALQAITLIEGAWLLREQKHGDITYVPTISSEIYPNTMPPGYCPQCKTLDSELPRGVGGWKDLEDGRWECECGYVSKGFILDGDVQKRGEKND